MTAPGAPPRVSVILRTKDRPALLAEALASLRAQSFPDFETLLVNSGGGIPESLLTPAPGRSLRILVPEPPAGRARSLNAGLAAASGEYVAYLDDDDLYRPAHLETLTSALDGDEAFGAAFSKVDQIAQRRGPDGLYRDGEVLFTYGRPFDARRLLYRNDVPLIALMHRRDLLEKVEPFDEAFDLYEDWDFLIRLSAATRLKFVPETTAVYRLRDDGTNATTATPWRAAGSQAARKALLTKHAARRTADTELALVDAYDEEIWLRESDLGTLRSRLARLEADLGEVSATAAGLKAERDALTRNLEDIHRSKWWKLATRWWKLKALLTR